MTTAHGTAGLRDKPDGGRDEIALLGEQLELTAARFPDRLAIAHADRRLTWAQVRDESLSVARALLARGVRRGDHVGVWLPNHPEWPLLWLGAVQIGAAVVPVNTRYRADEAGYVLRQSDAKILFIEDAFLDIDYRVELARLCPDRPDFSPPASQGLPMLEQVVVIGEAGESQLSWEEFRRGGEEIADSEFDAARGELAASDHVIIIFTSGTTGHPKGVLHTHDAVRMADTVTRWFALSDEDRILGHLPLFHVAGAFSSFLLAMRSGGALIQLDRWDPAPALELVESERITMLSGIPTHFHDLLHSPDLEGRDTSSLRTGWIGGSYIPREVVAGVRERLGMEALLPVYGMTETTGFTTLARPTDSVESRLVGKGVALGGYELAVVDPDTRRPVNVGVEGEVAVRGYTVMKGYYKEPEATAAAMSADGWFHTGDLGRLDEHGYLAITGRMSDKFIVGGNNVHPADVERVLLEHPALDVVHVVPARDGRLGEVPIAFVQPVNGGRVDEREVIAHARARLASFKVPRRVVGMTEWPMTPTGKVRRARLRELAEELAR